VDRAHNDGRIYTQLLILSNSIAYLDLSHTPLNGDCIRALWEGLMMNNTVATLRLIDCQLTNSCVTPLAEALVPNRYLTSLDLSHNSGLASSTKQLLTMLETLSDAVTLSTTLTCLKLDRCCPAHLFSDLALGAQRQLEAALAVNAQRQRRLARDWLAACVLIASTRACRSMMKAAASITTSFTHGILRLLTSQPESLWLL